MIRIVQVDQIIRTTTRLKPVDETDPLPIWVYNNQNLMYGPTYIVSLTHSHDFHHYFDTYYITEIRDIVPEIACMAGIPIDLCRIIAECAYGPSTPC
jgi:hypothetical protein